MAGPFYWAWVDATETTFTTSHVREDEAIFGFTVEQTEGEFASLSLELRNPRVGLLAPARRVWGWLSWDNGSQIMPLFFGRLVAVPDDMHLEVVTLSFTARPADYETRKASVADTMREPPFYDPVWVAEDKCADPDVVLEARSELWNIDRVTHELTTSDILVGEDGNEDFLASEVPYDSVRVRLNQPPLRSVSVDGTINWTQAGKGGLDFKRNANYRTFTGDGLIAEWPKTGASMGGGWTVTVGWAIDLIGIAKMQDSMFQGANNDTGQNPNAVPYPPDWLFLKTLDWSFVTSNKVEGILVPQWSVTATLRLGYDVERVYKEHIRFTLTANVQPIVTLPGEDEVLALSVNGADVGEPIDDELPIGDVRRRQYFPTGRGLQSTEYLIALARAHLLVRSRAVEVEFQCRFERAVALSCRKNARLFDGRLPGGNALGKIVRYAFSCNGDSGELIGNVTMGCAIGYGGAVTQISGEPTWVEDDYVEEDYQEYEGQVIVLGPGDVGYSPPGGDPQDDGLDILHGIHKWDVVSAEDILWKAEFQRLAIISNTNPLLLTTQQFGEQVKNVLKVIPTTIKFTLKPIEGGPFESAYDITVSQLEVPAMINLEASA